MSIIFQSKINLKLPSPLQELPSFVEKGQNIQCWIKRDDLIHPEISGNKWRKLKRNIDEMQSRGKSGILSFGGAYSNHVYALASAGKHLGFKTKCFIRGDAYDPENPTLLFAKQAGMELHFLDRSKYRQKDEAAFLQKIKNDFPDFYIVPEGGSNEFGRKGCEDIVLELNKQISSYDHLFVAAGTGTTAAGILSVLPEQTKLHVVSVLKGDFLKKEILKNQESKEKQLVFHSDYHFGGYAKFDESLIQFIRDCKKKNRIQLDPIYTGKLFFAVQDVLRKQKIEKGSKIVILHSGGLQGNAGFQKRFSISFD